MGVGGQVSVNAGAHLGVVEVQEEFAQVVGLLAAQGAQQVVVGARGEDHAQISREGRDVGQPGQQVALGVLVAQLVQGVDQDHEALIRRLPKQAGCRIEQRQVVEVVERNQARVGDPLADPQAGDAARWTSWMTSRAARRKGEPIRRWTSSPTALASCPRVPRRWRIRMVLFYASPGSWSNLNRSPRAVPAYGAFKRSRNSGACRSSPETKESSKNYFPPGRGLMV
ncbi:MAG: hypothetical protein M5U01_00500 [Ardenticatenaceae bacterium]|nr:hypothetical protein [Ardenticatenaceae bacterium]